MFSTQADNCIPIVHNFAIISLFPAKPEEPKIGLSGKGLIGEILCRRLLKIVPTTLT